jgi:hypothetical protein
MLKFKLLLWAFALLLQRKIRSSAACARYLGEKKLVFHIRTASGAGRWYLIEKGAVRSFAGLTDNAAFTFTFSNAAKGFEILSAKDAQPAFLRGVGSKDLIVSGDFREVMWFQGLTAYLQPPKVIAPRDRSPF